MITPIKTTVTFPANTTGYYVLWYDTTSKKISNCRFVKGITTSPATTEAFESWDEVKSRVAKLKLTGLTDKDPALAAN